MTESFMDEDKFEQLVEIIAPGSCLLRTWSLQGGISAEMTAFEIKNPDGQISRMILRRPGEQTLHHNPRAAEAEFKTLQLAKSLGLATPTPYYLDSTGTIFSTPYLVMEYIEGKLEFPRAPMVDFTLQLAKQLAQIHSADISEQATSFLPKAANECIEGSRKQPKNIQPALEIHQIHAVLEKASSLHKRNKPVLLHGDFWPGNVLWKDSTLTAVVDWEDAQIGDPLIDFAISRLDFLWIFGIDSFHAFTHHYQSLMDIDYANLPYWDLCAARRLARLIGEDLAGWIAFFHPFGRHDITERTFREHFKYFVTQTHEKW